VITQKQRFATETRLDRGPHREATRAEQLSVMAFPYPADSTRPPSPLASAAQLRPLPLQLAAMKPRSFSFCPAAQLGEIDRHAPRLVQSEGLSLPRCVWRSPAAVEHAELLSVGILDRIPARHLDHAPWRRKSAGRCHGSVARLRGCQSVQGAR